MMDELMRDRGLRELATRLHPEGDPTEVLARAAWSVLSEPGDGVAGSLIAALGAAEAVRVAFAGDARSRAGLDASEILSVDNAAGVLKDARDRWRPRANPEAVRAAISSASEVGATLLLPGDDAWPMALDDLGAHAPVMLWVRGESQTLNVSPSVAVVGARAATSYGENITAELAGDLAASGALIVSGGAYGIDGAAHRAALGVGGATIAFLAGGVDRAYPFGHHQLFERIIGAGAVVAEVPCGTPPTKWRFLSRNRLIAALGQATVVVEAGWRSGSLNTAGHASALGRPLGAVPGPVTSPASAGCHRLMREYDAQCVTTAAEVRELWGEAPMQTAEQTLRADPDATRLLDALSTRNAVAPHEAARRAGLGIDRVRALLGTLELEGLTQHRENGWVKSTQTRR